MEPAAQIQQARLRIGAQSVPGQSIAVDGTATRGRKPRLADRLAFFLLALGLLALGGVLLAAGAVLLAALATGRRLIGCAAAIWPTRRRLPPFHVGLAPGEVPADGGVLPPEAGGTPLDRPSSLPVVRGD